MQVQDQATQVTRRVRWSPTIKLVIGIVLIVLAGLAIYTFRIVFFPLVIGALMAYILQPLARLIHRATRLPYGLATGLLYLALLAVVIPIIMALVPVVLEQASLLQNQIIQIINDVQSLSPETTVEIMGLELSVRSLVDELASELTGLVRAAATGSIGFVLDAAETLLLIIFTVLAGFYLTRDASKFLDWFKGLAPRRYREDIGLLLNEINDIWRAFFQGQVVLVLIVSVILTAISAALGLPQPVLLGVFGGLLEFLPSVGHAIWLFTAVILALVEGSTYLPVSNVVLALIVGLAHLLYTQFDLNFLIPRIIGRQVHLHPMVIIIGIIIGAQVGGVLGVVLAAPTIASLRVLGRYIYAGMFDLEPFPMVGPPSAPLDERLHAAGQADADTGSPPTLREALPALREALPTLRRRKEGRTPPPEAEC